MTRRMSQISTQQESVDEITHSICEKHRIRTCAIEIFRGHYIICSCNKNYIETFTSYGVYFKDS